MKKIITESQLKQIIKETVRRVLNEGKDANQLADAFVRKNPNLNKEGLVKLLMADPTASQNDRGSFAGKYGVWIGNMYANGGIKHGDAPELKTALFTYDKNKTQLPPIKDCKSLSELIEWVKDLSDDFKAVRNQSKAKADLEKVYEDDEWVVYVPHSHAAARRGGEGTHWCTASENDYYYNMYSKQGPLYINIRKSDGAKFQFHFESAQFMDADDDPVSLKEIGLSDGLTEFYTKIDHLFKYRTEFDVVGKVNDGFAAVKLNGMWNFINTEGQILSNQWFDYVRDFNEGFAVVRLNGKCNFINTERQFLSKQWFDMAWEFNEGFAAVQLNDKWNFINPEGRILSEQWFDTVRSFNNRFAIVELNDKCNIINTEGQIVSKQWFDWIGNFNDELARVKLNGMWNFINTEGKIAFKLWFGLAGNFNKGFAKVELNGKWYNLDKEGNLTLAESRSPSSPVITESQLRNIIKEAVRRVLNEGKDANQLADAFVRKNPNIDKNGLIKLLMADPTASQNGMGSFAGRYGVWIGNMYANGGIKPGDAPELKSALFTYDKNKTQLPQIKDCKSLSELIEWVKDLSDDFKPVRKQSKAKADLEKVYEDDEWVVYVPHSHAAARRGGEGTHWCTASENDYYYNMYSKDGPLYINIRKSDGAKFQFHFESNQFMDADDDPVSLKEIGLSEGIIDFYNQINPIFDAMLKCDFVDSFNEGFARVKLNSKQNFINTEGQILSKQWFDWADVFKEGFASVRLNGKWNFINTKGQFLSKQWFDWVADFNEGFAKIKLNGKWNFINTEGRLLSQQWFDSAGVFMEGLASVKLNGKYNFINPKGQIAFKQWFDIAWSFDEGFAKVELNGKWYNLDKEGNLTLAESRSPSSPVITESQLRNIIKEAVRRVLKEGKDANQLADAFVRKNPNIDKNGLIKLLMADPTASQNDRGSFAGKYGVWIGNMYANGGIKPGDIPELKSALITYDKNKTRLPQIKDCKSLSELIEWVKDLSDDFKPVRKQSKAKADLEKVYEDDEWVVYVPHSHAAARRGGEGTHWCTASENDYYYNIYSKDGPLYINIRKSDGAKFQFHFESDQFMDADDEPIRLNKIGISEGLISFYSKIDPTFKFKLKFDRVGEFTEGFAQVKLNGKWNFINTEGQILSKQWFDGVKDFKEGVAAVMLNGKWNFINTEGQILSKQWFDWADIFKEGFASVRLNGKWNFINTEGQILSKQWFDCVKDFKEGVAAVMLNGKWNFINTERQIVSKQWFDWVWSFNRGFAVARLNGKYNFINTEGRILSKQWFDDVGNFNEGFAAVQLNNKWNFINTEGQLVSNQWFDDVDNFNEGVAKVELNGKRYNLDTEGGLTLRESRSPSSPVITESILKRIKSECIKRLIAIK